MKSNRILLSLFFLCIAAIAGTLMRVSVFTNVFLPYENMLHAHSHIAFQGWLYLALFLLITRLFLNPDVYNSFRYRWQLYTTILILFGILISFLYQGYGAISIVFSSLFQVMNYVFAITFFVDSKKQTDPLKPPKLSLKFVRASLVLLCISTLGPWLIAVINANGLAYTEYFDAALYFFFHFQYNGWFTFSALGLFLFLAEKNGLQYNLKFVQRSFQFLIWSVFPAYCLSLLGMSFAHFIVLPSFIVGVMQFIGLSFFLLSWRNSEISQLLKRNYFLTIATLCLILKFLLQIGSTIPSLNELAFVNKPIIIAYIHLTMLGFLTFVLLAILTELNWIVKTKTGWLLFALGFISSEIILVLLGFQPTLSLFKLIVLSSAFMMVGSILLFITQLFRR